MTLSSRTEAGSGFAEAVLGGRSYRALQLFIQVRDRYVTNKDRYPAWTAIGATALAMPGLLAEIKCTALLPD
jgi:enamine deaminase RidA (YjgF/YER057c/UK114 family)